MSIDFSLELPQPERNIFGKFALSITKNDPLAAKVMYYATFAIAFTAAGFALSASSTFVVLPCYALSIGMIPLALSVERLYQEVLCRELNEGLEKITPSMPTIAPKGLEDIRLSHLTQKMAKGMLKGRPFFAVKMEKEGVEYIDCYYREDLAWRNFNKVHARSLAGPKDLLQWQAWRQESSIFPDNQSSLPYEKLIEVFQP